jgi:hypothetical protein
MALATSGGAWRCSRDDQASGLTKSCRDVTVPGESVATTKALTHDVCSVPLGGGSDVGLRRLLHDLSRLATGQRAVGDGHAATIGLRSAQ